MGNRNCADRNRSGMTLVDLAIIIVVILILVVILFPIFAKPHRHPLSTTCLSNLKQLGLASMMYCDDNNGALPKADSWNEDLYPYTKSRRLLFCDHAEFKHVPSYAMNRNLAGKNIKKIKSPNEVVMLFDSVLGKNLCGGPEMLPQTPRHHGDHICFADGHAKRVSREGKALVWSVTQ